MALDLRTRLEFSDPDQMRALEMEVHLIMKSKLTIHEKDWLAAIAAISRFPHLCPRTVEEHLTLFVCDNLESFQMTLDDLLEKAVVNIKPFYVRWTNLLKYLD